MTKYSKILARTLIIISLVCTTVAFIGNDYKVSAMLPLAPLSFFAGIVFVSSYRRSALNSITIKIILGSYSLRMCVSALLLPLSNYSTYSITNSGIEHINEAVLLAIFEYLCVCLFILSSKRIGIIVRSTEPLENNRGKRNSTLVKFLFIALLFITGGCLIRYPSFSLMLNSISQILGSTKSDVIARANSLYDMRRNISSFVFQICKWGLYYIQALLPAMYLTFINRAVVNTRRTKLRIILSGVIVVFLSIMICTDDISQTFFIGISVILTLFSLYPDALKRILPFIIGTGGALAIAVLLAKLGLFERGTIDILDVSSILNAYFSGLSNISVGLSFSLSDRLLTLVGDVMSGVPILAHFFVDITTSVDVFNIALGRAGNTQIMPMICYGYQYLYILAPLLPIFFIAIALRFEQSMRKSTAVFDKYLYMLMLINTAVCPIMYGLPSGVKRLVLFMGLSVLIHFNNTRGRKST